MKVALAFPGCHRHGGVERVVWECGRFLASRGHEPHVFTADWEADGSRGPSPHIRYHPVAMRKRPRFLEGASFFRQCSRRLDPSAFDVVNPHGTVCPVGGVHWVHSLHRAWLERAREIFGPSSNRVLKQRLNPVHPILLRLEERHFGERAYARLIVTTPRVRDDLQRLYGVPPSDVDVLGIGFSPDDFAPERRSARRSEMREQLGLRQGDVALLFVANELERKGYRTVLGALALLGRPNIRLLVVGRPSRGTVLRLADRYGVRQQVVACGTSADVADFHAAAD
jgi:UDP-glucose:(heptosyl)LPS alpha-1,3-glucosyltransferase